MADMEINVLIDEVLEEHPELDWLQGVAEQVLMAQGAVSDAELGLLITSQEKVRQLNCDYRGKDTPTDVLSFYMTPSTEETSLPSFITPPDGVRHLGEVIISHPQAALQAKAHRHSLRMEIAILIIHGVLHLLGYDHERPKDKRQMRAREKEILSHIAGLE